MRVRQKTCPECGRILRHAYGFHCTVCDGPKLAKRYQAPVIRENKHAEEWAASLDRSREVSYPLAAATWGCPLKEAIKRVNALVQADILRSGSGTGRFRWRKEDEL